LYSTVQQAALIDLQQAQGEAMPSYDITYLFLQSFLESALGSMSLVVLPLLAMGLYTEERKQGTLELLVTAPIANWQVALGKLLAAETVFGVMIAPFGLWEWLTVAQSTPPFPPALLWLGHGALLLQGAAVLAWGMWLSACSSNTLVAAFGTFLLVTLWNNIDLLAERFTGWGYVLISHLSVVNHYRRLAGGVLDLGSIWALISYTLVGILLTALAIEWGRR
jgi:ABC-2 type transport system permease protein